MNLYGWHINLSGSAIPVYRMSGYPSSKVQIGKINNNECFVEGSVRNAPYEGDAFPVHFVNSSKQMVQGVIESIPSNIVSFGDYASNGTSWSAVSTLKRKVQYATVAYYSDGSKCCDLPAGSYVWLTENCTRGDSNHNYVAVTKVTTSAGKTYTFSDNNVGFVDLTYGSRYVTVGNILLRKA